MISRIPKDEPEDWEGLYLYELIIYPYKIQIFKKVEHFQILESF